MNHILPIVEGLDKLNHAQQWCVLTVMLLWWVIENNNSNCNLQ